MRILNRDLIFTNRRHTYKGIMATILGVIDVFSVWYAVYATYLRGGEATSGYAAACILIIIFSATGIILGAMSKNDPDRFHFFSYVGIVLNILSLIGISAILYAGAYII